MRVTRVLVALSNGHTGYDLLIHRNVVDSHRPVWEETYSGLLWTELVDVLLEELEAARPGWELDEGRRWRQAPLWAIDD